MATHAEIVDRVMLRSGLAERALVERALDATAEMLGEQLRGADVALIAAQLPSRLGGALQARAHRPGAPLEELYEHLSVVARVPFGEAMELAGAACEALGGALDAETRVLLCRRLPETWAALASERAPAAVPEHPRGTSPGQGHTLATGRPGSLHPLSEAHPREAQAESIARAENPHGERKLSSGRPDTAEQALANGRPGASASLADARDERRDR
jgi:uncharacterized protein (DUF2267 family)